MADKKKKGDGRERVALDAGVVQRVREYKKNKLGPAISTFFEKAATDKLDKLESRESEKVGGKK
jgi:hypothetical protein